MKLSLFPRKKIQHFLLLKLANLDNKVLYARTEPVYDVSADCIHFCIFYF